MLLSENKAYIILICNLKPVHNRSRLKVYLQLFYLTSMCTFANSAPTIVFFYTENIIIKNLYMYF